MREKLVKKLFDLWIEEQFDALASRNCEDPTDEAMFTTGGGDALQKPPLI